MSTDRKQQIQALFEEAISLPDDQQEPYLGEVCKTDAKLQAEVQSLLDHDQNAPADFMQPLGPSPDFDLPEPMEIDGPDPRIGTRIGGYLIEGIIARGGMGAVYQAVQDQPRRTVALKVLRRNVASRSALRRFQFESQILAHLRHPNIAQVYVAGMHDHGEGEGKTPYFVMEYVPQARSIVEYAEQEGLSTRDKLDLFAQACDGVHHGHQKGIIHRDLKPGNILVANEQSRDDEQSRARKEAVSTPAGQNRDDEPSPKRQRGVTHATARVPVACAQGSDQLCLMPQARVKIIDFGVARATDSDIAVTTMQTDAGQIIGTLQYMSPEQCDADPNEIDTRSDVYSLGVVLYELLCGQLPYDVTRSTVYQAAQVIREQTPARPSTITGRRTGVPPVDRDAETIALKALEKDREERYGSAADLAQDIRRHLAGEPIEARPPGVWMKALRWVGRRPILASTTAGLAVASLIIVTTFVALWIVNSRPHAIARYHAGKLVGASDREGIDEIRLLAYSRRELCRWGGPSDSIASAALAQRPARFGGGKVAVIGYRDLMLGQWRSTLSVYDLDGDLDVPYWHARVVTEDVLPVLQEKRGMTGGYFSVHVAELEDVFRDAEHPGDEIVVVFANAQSQRLIRIYDLDGTLLYQVWHEGSVTPPYWMANPGLLVFSGDNALYNWDRAGGVADPRPNPIVVFAIRPQAGYFGEEDETYLKCEPGSGPASAVWYKELCIGKEVVRQRGGIGITELSAPLAADPDRSVHLGIQIDTIPGAHITWTIDEFGDEVPNSREPGDHYKIDQASDNPQLPDLKLIRLRDFKPPPSTSQPATQAGEG